MTLLAKAGIPALLIVAVALGGVSLAQQHGGHAGHGAAPAKADSPATAAFKAAAMAMHKDMDIAYTGDVDADFVRGMIPHHQGAIAMAKIMLAHGKSPELKALAAGIIADQDREIAAMRDWLAKNGK